MSQTVAEVIPGIPRHLIERAAADPRNAHAEQALRRMAGASRTSAPREPENAAQSATARTGRAGKRRGVPNATEVRFAREVLDPLVLSGYLVRYECEGMTLRIPNVGACTPDYVGWTPDGVPVLFEVKGCAVHEATVLRMKAHAAARPWLRFLIYKRKDRRWVKHFDSASD